MHLFPFLILFSNPLPTHSKPSPSKPPAKNAILLSNVHTLTLHGDNRQTTSRRLPPIPQLTCTGPSKRICNLYAIDSMRCRNEGFDYDDEEDVQWTCTADLPPEFKLGSTDVVCEGYRGPEDRWVLKGSCGVEYRLLLTEKGEERFGRSARGRSRSGWRDVVGEMLFFGVMALTAGVILVSMLRACFGRRVRPGQRRRWGGFWGGGGGDDGYGYPPGPPPPYSSHSSSWFSTSPAQGWRPGFWSGALGGGSLGYELGRRSRGYDGFADRRPARRFNDRYDPGEGSSGSRPTFSSTGSSTGFGSTRRR